MKCEDCEPLLADALGGELSSTGRVAFEEHIAQCGACRREYETASRTLDELRSLPAPRQMSLRGIGTTLVPDVPLRLQTADSETRRASAFSVVPRRSFGRVLRYAASLLIAFTAGYALHAGFTLSGNARSRAIPQTGVAGDSIARAQTLEAAFTRVHLQQPARSALAKAMIAMVPRR